MIEENANEIVIGQVVYAFTSAAMAKAFEACLSTGTLSTCKESWRPAAIYPPTSLDAKVI